MNPFLITETLPQWGSYLVYLFIGFSFGYVLEIAGFGDSRKLAAQFYFKEQTVLKVMFTAIVVAMVLIFWAASLGWIDYNLVWVNPTYLWPGIVGGLIMGAGFIIGGFCPGTSLVAAATLKIDGIFFALGAFVGIFLFGESVGSFESFWHSSYLGRFTLQDWLGLETGTVVLLVVLMAVFMFWGAEKLERIFGDEKRPAAPRWRYAAAGLLVIGAVGLMLAGQPTTADRWTALAPEKEPLLTERQVQIHPGELLELLHDAKLNPILLDVRPETDYNRFHLQDARHAPIDRLGDLVAELHQAPANTVFVVMSNDELLATEAWKTLVAEAVPNVYILEGGVNGWLATFAEPAFQAEAAVAATSGKEQLRYRFDAALGDRHPAATPNLEAFELIFTPKVELELKRGPSGGGCG